jgi:predicted TIM-barrel fold metal-dependent hydrolase
MSFIPEHAQPPRPRFMRRSFVFLGTLAASARARTRRPEAPPVQSPAHRPVPSPEPAEPGAPFDAHLHCPSETGQVWQWHPVTRTMDEFVRHLDRTGVRRGIINNVRCQLAKTPADFVEGNREVARYVEKYTGRFLGACVVNPLFIDEALREIEDCRKQLGFLWVGELCNYTVPYKYSIEEFARLVEQVVKQHMVLDVHTTLPEMDYIIQKFPDATIVFPHPGEHSDIFKRIELVARHPNCYLDTSGAGENRMGMLEYAVQTIGEDRVLYGSDFSINDPATGLARIRHAYLSEAQKRKILCGNLEALLKRFEGQPKA